MMIEERTMTMRDARSESEPSEAVEVVAMNYSMGCHAVANEGWMGRVSETQMKMETNLKRKRKCPYSQTRKCWMMTEGASMGAPRLFENRPICDCSQAKLVPKMVVVMIELLARTH
jgi:hypothetical protein